MVKKLDEIKEAISTSTNSTPVKVHISDRIITNELPEGENESNDGSSEGGEQRLRRISTETGSYRGSITNLKDYEETLPDSLYATVNEEKNGNFY